MRVSRSGEMPEPTVIVWMKENSAKYSTRFVVSGRLVSAREYYLSALILELL